MSGKKILLIDGHGIAFRAFYAIPELNAPDGTPTNALVGFFNMFARVRHDQRPDEIYRRSATSSIPNTKPRAGRRPKSSKFRFRCSMKCFRFWASTSWSALRSRPTT